MQTNTNIEKPNLLSKWWQTDSCRKAFERANNSKRAKLDKFLADRQAHQAYV